MAVSLVSFALKTLMCNGSRCTVDLSEVFPDKLMLGMEIRMKVTEFVRLRILAARNDSGTKEVCATSILYALVVNVLHYGRILVCSAPTPCATCPHISTRPS